MAQHKLTTEMLLHQMSTYPVEFDFPEPNLLFDLLCAKPTNDTELLSRNARHLLRLLHPDKNPSVQPATSKLIPTVKEARNNLTCKDLNKVYRCCGLEGVRLARRKLRTCLDCDNFFADW